MNKKDIEFDCENFHKIKNEINKQLDGLSKDACKFYDKNNDIAGVRLRKGYKVLKNYITQIINESLNNK